jgi:hypothetical protein
MQKITNPRRIPPPSIARAAYPKPAPTFAQLIVAAQHAGAVAEQAAQMVEHFVKTLPNEREEWDPPLDFRTLVLHCDQLRCELLEYTTWAEQLAPDPDPDPDPAA